MRTSLNVSGGNWSISSRVVWQSGQIGSMRTACRTTQLLNQQLAIETAHPPVGKVAPDQTQCHVQGLILGLVAGAGWRASRIDPDHRATLAAHQHAQADHAARHQFAQSTIRLGEQARSEDENDRADDQEVRR